LRFYSVEHHTDLDSGTVLRIEDARETAERRERDMRAVASPS
jgi:hypothetical protein